MTSDKQERANVDRAQLVTIIENAFPKDPPWRIRKIPRSMELDFLCDEIGPRRYAEISPEVYSVNGDAISFLQDELLQFYLPGFLIASLFVDPAKSDLPNHIVSCFVPSRRSQAINNLIAKKLESLNEEQKMAIIELFEYFRKYYREYMDLCELDRAVGSLQRKEQI